MFYELASSLAIVLSNFGNTFPARRAITTTTLVALVKDSSKTRRPRKDNQVRDCAVHISLR